MGNEIQAVSAACEDATRALRQASSGFIRMQASGFVWRRGLIVTSRLRALVGALALPSLVLVANGHRKHNGQRSGPTWLRREPGSQTRRCLHVLRPFGRIDLDQSKKPRRRLHSLDVAFFSS